MLPTRHFDSFPASIRTALFATVFTSCLLAPLNARVEATPTWQESTDIEAWIEGLDSSRFEEREAATRQLIAEANVALRPLALHFFDASPESAWRIKRILKTIGTEATDETTSLKAIGILVILDHQLDNEMASLLAQWRENRSNRAIEHLIRLGAKTSDASDRSPRVRINPFGQIQDFSIRSEAPANPLRTKSRRKLSASAAQKEIEKIVDGGLKEVQKFIFEKIPAGSAAQQAALDDRWTFVAGMNGFRPQSGAMQSTYLEIGPAWQGTSVDLQRLKEIHTLYALHLVDHTFDANDLRVISELENLQHIGLCNSVVENGNLSELHLPAQVSSIELGLEEIDRDLLEWLELNSARRLILDECTFDKSASSRFADLDSVQDLELRRLKIDSSLFQQLGRMPKLERLVLSVCKFQPQHYRSFVRVKPRVIDFDPVCFLGVQGVRTGGGPDEWSCQIEMVVPDSSADEAGIKAGDVIELINGSRVQSFEELRMHISQHEVGEQMELEIDRDRQKLKLTATLKSRDATPNP